MSLIQKLGIIGIRSYSPHKVSEIEFGKPITLILGHNGAGKTVLIKLNNKFISFCFQTIIECLRQITTSTFPPYSQNGHTFIQDPSITNVPELKGQLKLRFSAVNGKQIFACKTFSISRTGKNKSDSFRTTESYLKTKNEQGEIMSINHTCSEMDKQVPALLGVSKEILENVVFCHQEEANWPLGDSQDLRRIFDELFGTERMTKIVESLRQVKKEMNKSGGISLQNE